MLRASLVVFGYSDKTKTDVSYVDNNSQYVSVKVSLLEQSWILSAIYASPTKSIRDSL